MTQKMSRLGGDHTISPNLFDLRGYMYEVGDEVVYCPTDMNRVTAFLLLCRSGGASGEVVSRETKRRYKKGKNGEKIRKPPKVKAVNVRWKQHRKGVSVFKLTKGKKRAKNEGPGRFVESGKDLHPLSYCYDCPLRLQRLVKPCRMSKQQAIEKYGRLE